MRLFTVASTPPSALPPRSGRVRTVAALLACSALLGGCDMLGIDTPAKQAARREADGRAIGAGCRQTQRSLEDCYAANPGRPRRRSLPAGAKWTSTCGKTTSPRCPPPRRPRSNRPNPPARARSSSLPLPPNRRHHPRPRPPAASCRALHPPLRPPRHPPPPLPLPPIADRLTARVDRIWPHMAAAAHPQHSSSRSKTAMLSTCAVWGNMLTTPAAVHR